MESDQAFFRKIEILGWIVLGLIVLFGFGHVFIFIGIVIAVRYAFNYYKNSKLALLDIPGKSVIVTGCDSGFGLGLALRLCDRGFNVFATCLNLDSDGAKKLKEREAANHMTVLELDVTSDDMVQRVLERVRSECDTTGLWGLVNNAGQDFVGDAEMTTMGQYLKVGNINLYGVIRMCRAFLPLVRQTKGRIINVTSIKGLVVVPFTAAYTVTKHGGEAFTEVLRQEVAHSGVKVIAIEPGNFGGATGCLNDAGIARMTNDLNVQWEEATEEARRFYPQAHLQNIVKEAKDMAGTSSTTIEPVLDAVEDALRNVCPRVRYLVGGSRSYIDIYALFARAYPFLPQEIYDRVRAYLFPYKIHRA